MTTTDENAAVGSGAGSPRSRPRRPGPLVTAIVLLALAGFMYVSITYKIVNFGP